MGKLAVSFWRVVVVEVVDTSHVGGLLKSGVLSGRDAAWAGGAGVMGAMGALGGAVSERFRVWGSEKTEEEVGAVCDHRLTFGAGGGGGGGGPGISWDDALGPVSDRKEELTWEGVANPIHMALAAAAAAAAVPHSSAEEQQHHHHHHHNFGATNTLKLLVSGLHLPFHRPPRAAQPSPTLYDQEEDVHPSKEEGLEDVKSSWDVFPGGEVGAPGGGGGSGGGSAKEEAAAAAAAAERLRTPQLLALAAAIAGGAAAAAEAGGGSGAATGGSGHGIEHTGSLGHQVCPGGVPIKDRTYHLKTYRACLLGSELVSWLVQHGHAVDRTAALEVGRRLGAARLLWHVVGEHELEDAARFYRVADVRGLAAAAAQGLGLGQLASMENPMLHGFHAPAAAAAAGFAGGAGGGFCRPASPALVHEPEAEWREGHVITNAYGRDSEEAAATNRQSRSDTELMKGRSASVEL